MLICALIYIQSSFLSMVYLQIFFFPEDICHSPGWGTFYTGDLSTFNPGDDIRDGLRYIYTYAPFPSGKENTTKGERFGYVIVGISTALIYAEADRVLWGTLAALAGLTLLALSVAWVGGNFFLMRRVNALLTATRRMAKGDLTARTGIPYGISELSQLAPDITERKQAERQISKQLQILTALYGGSQKLAESLDTHTVATETVRTCVELFDVKLAWIGLAEEDGRVTVISQLPPDCPYPRQITVRWDDTPEGQGPTGCAIRSGVQKEIPDLLTAPEFALWRTDAEKYSFRSSGLGERPSLLRGTTSPERTGSEEALLGVLMVARALTPEKRPFTSEQMRLLTTISEMVGTALRRMSFYHEALRRLKQVQALRSIDMAITSSLDPRATLRILLDEVTTQLNVDAAGVLLLNPARHRLYRETRSGHGYKRGRDCQCAPRGAFARHWENGHP